MVENKLPPVDRHVAIEKESPTGENETPAWRLDWQMISGKRYAGQHFSPEYREEEHILQISILSILLKKVVTPLGSGSNPLSDLSDLSHGLAEVH